jgi:subtilisin family serine protease
MVARLAIFDFHLQPRIPTIEQARAHAQEFRDTISYFKQQGVRVVNMSWMYGPQEVEGELAANGAGGSADERRTLARRIYEIKASALQLAMKEAPEILFIVGAGNSNSDNRFGEEVPSALGLANILTVGAVDHAGDEANFTGYGQVDVYASGYLREMMVPGGKKELGSGTSFAAPEVTNLAAKLLDLYPQVSCQQLRSAILLGAEDKQVTADKKIKLLHPHNSLELLAKAKSR